MAGFSAEKNPPPTSVNENSTDLSWTLKQTVHQPRSSSGDLSNGEGVVCALLVTVTAEFRFYPVSVVQVAGHCF